MVRPSKRGKMGARSHFPDPSGTIRTTQQDRAPPSEDDPLKGWLVSKTIWKSQGNYPSHTHFPPTIVRSIGMLMSCVGSVLKGSRPRTTRSASFPGSIEPLTFSSYDA